MSKPTAEEFKEARAAFRRLIERIDEAEVKHGLPLPTPRRGKKLPAWVDSLEGKQAFAAAIGGMDEDLAPAFRALLISMEDLQEMLANAVLAGDHSTLFNVAEAVKAARERHHLTVFTKHVAAVLEAKREIFAMSGSIPKKATVRKLAEKILTPKGENPYEGEERWKEVFAAAKQKDLEQLRKPRGKSRRGD
jgi:hypothetical protein